MAATATAPAVTREIIRDRWRMATTDTVLDDHSPAIPSEGNSKAMRRLMMALEVLAGRMVEDGIHSSEEAGWCDLQCELLNTIEEMIESYALELEMARAKRRKVVAA